MMALPKIPMILGAHGVQALVRRDTAARWEEVNPVLKADEIGYETDTDIFKVGDGIREWVDLRSYRKSNDNQN
jgi:hypothetical protein